MAEVAAGLDPGLVEEFQFVDRVRTLFKAAGVFVAYWEAYCLSQSQAPALRRTIERASAPGAPAVPVIPVDLLESLRVLRDRGSPIISKLRRLFVSRPGTPEEAEVLEMAFAVMVGSERGREAVGRWVLAPDRHAQEANERIRQVMQRLDPLRQAIRMLSGAAAAAPAPVAAAPEPEPAPAPAAPPPPAAEPPPPPPEPSSRSLTSVRKAPSALPPELAGIMVSAPGVPTELRSSSARGRVSLEWKAVEGASRYNVKRSDGWGNPYLTIATPKENAFADEKVTNGAQYVYVVSSANEAGESDDSESTTVTALAPPAAPGRVSASSAAGRITITWSPVLDASHYRVKRAPAPGGPYALLETLVGVAYADAAVRPGETYSYVVCATGSGGEGPDSAPVQASLLLPPVAPGRLSAAPAAGRVSLVWSPVPEAAVYRVKRSADAAGPFAVLASVDGVSFVDESVQPGGTYHYVVGASGPGGESPNSSPAVALVPSALAAPTGLHATAGNQRIALKWAAVPEATGYVVKRAVGSGGAFAPVARVSGTTYADTSVSNGGTYSYLVQAVNATGESAASAPATAQPVGSPGAPTGLAATSDHRRLWLNWSPVPGATFYNVKRSSSPNGPFEPIVTGVRQIRQDDEPPRGTKVYYVVSAVGPGGEGPDCAPVAKVLQTPPQTPAGLSAAPSHGRITLSWTAAPGATRYHVKRRVGANAKYVTLASPAEPTHADTTVSHGTTYEYVVSSSNGELESPDSAPVKAEPASAPAVPTGLSAQAGDRRVSLSWSAASGAEAYRIQRTTAKEAIFAEIATIKGATTYLDEGVTNGSTYDYAVVAIGPGGQSPPSMRARATPIGAPPVPRNLQGSAGQGRVLLSWSASAGAATYVVKRATSAAGPYATVATIVDTTYTDTSVSNGTTYHYKVSAANAGGGSDDAGPLQAMPVDVPVAPSGLTLLPGDHQISLLWQPSPGTATYTIKRATSPKGPFTTIATVEGTSHTDKDVDPRSTYHYTITAANAAGRSGASEPASAAPKPRT